MEQQQETTTRPISTQEFVLDDNIAAAIASAGANQQQQHWYRDGKAFQLSNSSAFSTPTRSTTTSVQGSPKSSERAISPSVTSFCSNNASNNNNNNIAAMFNQGNLETTTMTTPTITTASAFTPVVLLDTSMAYTPGMSLSVSQQNDDPDNVVQTQQAQAQPQPQGCGLEMEPPTPEDDGEEEDTTTPPKVVPNREEEEGKKDETEKTDTSTGEAPPQLPPNQQSPLKHPPPPSSPKKGSGRVQISMTTTSKAVGSADSATAAGDSKTIVVHGLEASEHSSEQSEATMKESEKDLSSSSGTAPAPAAAKSNFSSTNNGTVSSPPPPPPHHATRLQQVETPRASNPPVRQEHHSESSNQTKKQQPHSPEWTKNVDSVAASVNLALSKLRDFATPYMAGTSHHSATNNNDSKKKTSTTSTNDAIPPDAVDTSTESMADHDTNNDLNASKKNRDDWNLKELMQELQQHSQGQQQQQQESAAPTQDEDPHHVVANAVNAMISSLAAANNARQQQHQQQRATQQHYDKPPAIPKHQSNATATTTTASGTTTAVTATSPPTISDGGGLVTSLQHAAAAGCAVVIPPRKKKSTTEMTRAVTPIARMRDSSSSQQNKNIALDHNNRAKAAATTSDQSAMGERTRSDTSDAAMLEKHRRWKEKMKAVGKMKENKKRKSKRGSHRPRFEKYEPSVGGAPTCQEGFMHLVESFWSSRCGQWDDAMTEMAASRDDSTAGSFSTEDSHDESSNHLNTSMEVTEASEPITEADSRLSVIRSLRSPLQDEVEQAKKHDRVDLGRKPPGLDTTASGDRNFIRSFIASTREKGVDLIVHKRHRIQALGQPKKVTAFIRPGKEQLSGMFSTPTLEWKSEKEFYEKVIDLFDIKSVDKASALQLEQYPLAMPGRSVMLRTNGGMDYVFETRDEGTAFQFVHGLRWLVARLSFNLIIGNLNISCELLDVDDETDRKYPSHGRKAFPETPAEDARWTRAMNDATNILVEKSPCSF